MEQNYLKNWRTVRAYVKARYNITQSELDTLFFLYSEKYFTRGGFEGFQKTLSWTAKVFDNLRTKGYIVIFCASDHVRKPTIYQLSPKAEKLIRHIYKVLEGKPISENGQVNPLFRNDTSSLEKAYRNMIVKMNKATALQRHHPSE